MMGLVLELAAAFGAGVLVTIASLAALAAFAAPVRPDLRHGEHR
jgi:hypothetical protein